MVVIFVSMLIKMVRQWNNVGKKPEKRDIISRNFKEWGSFMDKSTRSSRS
jgi:hypothetical protein